MAAVIPETGSVATGSASRASPSRKCAHGLTGAAGWAAFGWLWFSQVAVHQEGWARDLYGIGGTLVAFTVLSLVWVRWNHSIYGRRHQRRAPMLALVLFAEDTVGRRISALPGLRRRAGEIIVSIDPADKVKHYDPAAPHRKEQPVGKAA